MDFFNNIAKAVVDTVSNVTKAVANINPSDAKGMIQPIGHKLEVRKVENEIHTRIVNVAKKNDPKEESPGLF